MHRIALLLILTMALIAADLLVRLHAYGQSSQSSAASSQPSARPQPLILQEGDGDHRVRRTGPNGGWPFTIKLDGQAGNAQDFFVLTETMAPGQTIPFHKHDNAEEILLFEEAGATVIVGDKRGVAGPRSVIFIPRDTWISATNAGAHDIHLTAVFSRQGFERYLRAASAKQGEPLAPMSRDELDRLRALGHSMYWDATKGPFPPGVAHP